MKYSSVIAFSLIAVASAQSQSASPSASAPATSTVPLSPAASCALKCPQADVCCQALCVGVPCPDAGMANKTNDCAAHCNQGKGTPADIDAYAKCQAACISSYFFSGTATLPAATGSAAPSNGASPTNAPSGGATGGPTGGATGSRGGQSGSASATASKPASTSNAASGVTGASAGTFFGLILAAFAL
ncbi:hypothetical protein PRK78_004242 [Emydomyces testavorans]|uniref:Uncharacterized protein n=1 Tax=Emydomyces testavorans TaxID=2070801 RepID=A0AAF0DIF0_9EURO|nr:hypothetical protein PRK78_004242 [Emydomyces testavorans]